MRYPDHLTCAAARGLYFAANNLSEQGYTKRWVRLNIGPLPLMFPNSRARVRALMLHDLHHIATGYGTDLRGEGEQSAWELGAGCGHHWFAWAINLGGVAMGMLLAPRRTWRAFRRGRRSRTLYGGEFDERLLETSVGSLRRALGLDTKPV